MRRLFFVLVCGVGLALPGTGWSAWASDALLEDGFAGTAVDASSWHIPTWAGNGDGTYVGRTQFRVAQNSPLPKVSRGDVQITVQTYNPTGFSFYGTDLISDQSFLAGDGVDVVVRARMDPPDQPGVVGGIFLYGLKEGSNTLHDEIDFELLGSDPGKAHTNIYANEPFGAGHPAAAPYESGSATDYHEYEFRWSPTEVSWYVDGGLVRVETSNVPTGPMRLHLNMWAPGPEWPEAYYDGIQPSASRAANHVFTMSVDSVAVTASTPPPVAVSVKAVSGQSKLSVNVDPDKGKGYWTFQVQRKRSDGTWAALKTYRTRGSKETRTVNCKKGTYRVWVNPKYGYQGTTSAEVYLKK